MDSDLPAIWILCRVASMRACPVVPEWSGARVETMLGCSGMPHDTVETKQELVSMSKSWVPAFLLHQFNSVTFKMLLRTPLHSAFLSICDRVQ